MTQTNYNERLKVVLNKFDLDDETFGSLYVEIEGLIKDLVADARPVRKLLESGDSVAVYYEKMLFEYEQNLLKLLETTK